MNQEEANKNIDKWGVLLLLNAPQQIELGIDNTSWIVGSKFKGIKLIPPGPHYIYYAQKSENYQFKLGFFIYISSKDRIHVRRWHEQFEDFVRVKKDEEEDFKLGVRNYDFDSYLGLYPMDRLSIWQEISSHISSEVIDRLNPVEKRMYLADQEYNQNEQIKSQNEQIKDLAKDIYGEDFYNEEELEKEEDVQQQQNFMEENQEPDKGQQEQAAAGQENQQQTEQQGQNNQQQSQQSSKQQETNNNNKPKEDSTMEQEVEVQQDKNNDQKKSKKQTCYDSLMEEIKKNQEKNDFNAIAGQIYYIDIPKRKMQVGVKGQDLTFANFDKSQILQDIIKTELNNDYHQIFGEMQYAFIVFLLGENYESFEHWKDLFILVTNCDNYVKINVAFYIELIPILYGQLQQFPKDFFIDNISSNNFMKNCLNGFVEICKSSDATVKLKKRCEKLVQLVETRFNFHFYTNENIIQQNNKGEIIYNSYDDDDGPVIVEDINDFIKL